MRVLILPFIFHKIQLETFPALAIFPQKSLPHERKKEGKIKNQKGLGKNAIRLSAFAHSGKRDRPVDLSIFFPFFV